MLHAICFLLHWVQFGPVSQNPQTLRTKISSVCGRLKLGCCNIGNTCVKGPCMFESLCMTLSYKSVFFGGTEWLKSLYVDWPIC